MQPGGASYWGLLAALRQNDLLQEASDVRRGRIARSQRRNRIIGRLLPQIRRHR